MENVFHFSPITFSDLISLFVGVGTILLAIVAFSQLHFIKSNQCPELEVIKVDFRIFALFNYGIRPAYRIKLMLNNESIRCYSSLENSKHIFIEMSSAILPYDPVSKEIEKGLKLIIEYHHKFSLKRAVRKTVDLSKLEKTVSNDKDAIKLKYNAIEVVKLG